MKVYSGLNNPKKPTLPMQPRRPKTGKDRHITESSVSQAMPKSVQYPEPSHSMSRAMPTEPEPQSPSFRDQVWLQDLPLVPTASVLFLRM